MTFNLVMVSTNEFVFSDSKAIRRYPRQKDIQKMRVNYIFLCGREQECFLPKGFPVNLIDTLLNNNEQGLVAIEILKVL